MGRRFTILSTAVVTAVLTSAFWIFTYNIMAAAEEDVELSGNIKVIDPKSGQAVAIAAGVVVGPAGMAIPVVGVDLDQLVDTYTQSRAGGGRQHDAIDIMAPAGTTGGRRSLSERGPGSAQRALKPKPRRRSATRPGSGRRSSAVPEGRRA